MSKYRPVFLASALCLILALWGCNGGGDNQPSSSTTATRVSEPKASPQAETASEGAEKPHNQEENPNKEDTDDPEYFSVLSKVRTEAQKYWDERFIKCGTTQRGDDRWFSYNPKEKSFMEVIKLRRFTSFPFRLSNADKYNKEWSAISVVQGEAWRHCSEGPCGKYQGGIMGLTELYTPMIMLFHQSPNFQSGLFTLAITVKKGKYSSDNPAEPFYQPYGCAEVKNHPIWKEY